MKLAIPKSFIFFTIGWVGGSVAGEVGSPGRWIVFVVVIMVYIIAKIITE